MKPKTPDELVAEAEARLRKRGTGDSYQPAFMTVDAAGHIRFDFTGHVSALGLELPISPGGVGSIDPDSMVEWIERRASTVEGNTGGYIATEGLIVSPFERHLRLKAQRTAAEAPPFDPVTRSAELSLSSHPDAVVGTGGAIEGIIEPGITGGAASQFKLIDASGDSDFVNTQGWKPLPYSISGRWVSGNPFNTIHICKNEGLFIVPALVNTNGLQYWFFNLSDVSMSGALLKKQWKIRATTLINGVAPNAGIFRASLHNITGVAGGANILAPTLSAVIAQAASAAPAVNQMQIFESAVFDAAALGSGYYCFSIFKDTAAVTAGCVVDITATIYERNTYA